MDYLGMSEAVLTAKGGLHTASEIGQQPGIWHSVYHMLRDQKDEILDFLDKSLAVSDEIYLTGAGTSAYIGLSLAREYSNRLGRPAQAVATTDLVTHPGEYFRKDKKYILVSFARSGNSPESLAAVELAEGLSAAVFHVVVTCNAEGELAGRTARLKSQIILLPPESNDRSLAMTSSYTSMFLAGLLVARIRGIEKEQHNVEMLVAAGRRILDTCLPDLKRIADVDFKRAVFLGSGPLLGTATEAQLKLQELSDGKIICKVDSFLGYRHGPKAVTDGTTLMVYLFSNDPYVLNYEKDLVASMKSGKKALYQAGIFENQETADNLGACLDLKLIQLLKDQKIDQIYLAICSVLPGQILGFFKSLSLGLKPDNPSESGAISRVVEGVNIYPYPAE